MKKILKVMTAVLMIGLFTGCGTTEETASSYKYEVTGTGGSFSWTYENADENTSQLSNRASGGTYSWTQTGTRWLYLSAQNETSYGNVTVTIYKDGKVIAQNTSSGGYTIATVSGTF